MWVILGPKMAKKAEITGFFVDLAGKTKNPTQQNTLLSLDTTGIRMDLNTLILYLLKNREGFLVLLMK
jgi:hypothetical protein